MVQLIDPGPLEFEAVVQGDGGGTWVDVPFDLKETYGKGNLVPIIATFAKKVTYQGSLAKMGGPSAVLLLRSDVRQQLGDPQPGDVIHVRLELDSAPRIVHLPEDANARLADAPEAAAFWETLSPTGRREYARWIEEAKRPETRERRITETIARLSRHEKMA